MLRVLIDCHSFELRERARDAILRVGGHPVERENDAGVCIAISAFGEIIVAHEIPTLVCEDGDHLEAEIVQWLTAHSNQNRQSGDDGYSSGSRALRESSLCIDVPICRT